MKELTSKTVETPAINVMDEAADVYWKHLYEMPEVIKKLSVHDLRVIFRKAVVPAIDKARQLDREGFLAYDEAPVPPHPYD